MKETKTCEWCYCLSEITHNGMIVCLRNIPNHIPNSQQFKFRNALVKKHRSIDCDKFLHKFLHKEQVLRKFEYSKRGFHKKGQM